MASLYEFKQQYPAYRDVPDMELADALHRKYYSEIPKEEYYKKLGLNSQTAQSDETPEMPTSEAILTSATNIPLVGMRAKAGIAAGTAKLLGETGLGKVADKFLGTNSEAVKGISLQELYNQALEQEKEKLQTAREQHPIASFGAELASDIATGGKILKGIGLAGNTAKKVIAGGAALSAAKTLGEEKDLTNIPKVTKDVGESAITGAIVSGAAQQAGKAIKSIAGTGTDLVKRLIKSREAEDILAQSVKPERAETLANKLAATKERITLLPDIAGEEVSGLTRLLAKTTGSKELINDVLSNRTAQSSRRVSKLINSEISGKSYFGNADDLNKARAEVSAPLFEKSYQEGSKIPKSQTAFLFKDGRIQSALKTARKDFGITAPDSSVETLHGVRQVLDDTIEAARRSGENNKARAYGELRKNLTSTLYEASPTLREADKTFAGFSALKNAQEEGLAFKKFASAEEVKRNLANKTPGEKDNYRIGMAESLMRDVNKTGDGLSAARKIFGNPASREKIKAAFDSPKQYREFARKMLDEIRIFDTKNRILGGSRTDINLANEGQIINKIASGAANIKTAGMSGLINAVTDSLKKRYIGLDESNARKLAQILTSKEKSIDVLRNIAVKAEKQKDNITKEAVNSLIPQILGEQVGSSLTNQMNQE